MGNGEGGGEGRQGGREGRQWGDDGRREEGGGVSLSLIQLCIRVVCLLFSRGGKKRSYRERGHEEKSVKASNIQ